MGIRTRSEVPPEEKWNVEALYPSWTAWSEELDRSFQTKIPRWPCLKERAFHLGSGLKEFLDELFQINRILNRLYVYAHLRFDEEVSCEESKKNFQFISGLLQDFQCESAWIEPALLSSTEELFHTWLHDPHLKEYQFYLQKMARRRPHTLPKEQEELIALSLKALEVPSRAFNALNNADFSFPPAIDSQGEKKHLTHGSYGLYLKSSDRELRRTAFLSLHTTFAQYANTLAELLQGQIARQLYLSRAHRYASCVEEALDADWIPVSVYSGLIQTVRQGVAPLHTYLALRKEKLHLKELHVYDLYVPLVELHKEISYIEACQLVIESVAPLGVDYQTRVGQGLLQERWVDIYENAKKRSGAYSSGCYDSMPYILMNYQGTLSDALTLAHEMGHSMHSFLSRTHQPYVDSNYSIFVAEVASIFNEQLLLDLLKQRAQTKKEKAYLIAHQIDAIRTTLFRQVLFAEFEWQLHRWAEEDLPLTPSRLNELYLQLHRDYYGPALTIDPELHIEWARIPHFYSNFYVYQYATGLSAAIALFRQVKGSTAARDRYLAFLQSGGSRPPLELLAEAGVDLRTAAPLQAAVDYFSILIQEFQMLIQ